MEENKYSEIQSTFIKKEESSFSLIAALLLNEEVLLRSHFSNHLSINPVS